MKTTSNKQTRTPHDNRIEVFFFPPNEQKSIEVVNGKLINPPPHPTTKAKTKAPKRVGRKEGRWGVCVGSDLIECSSSIVQSVMPREKERE